MAEETTVSTKRTSKRTSKTPSGENVKAAPDNSAEIAVLKEQLASKEKQIVSLSKKVEDLSPEPPAPPKPPPTLEDRVARLESFVGYLKGNAGALFQPNTRATREVGKQ